MSAALIAALVFTVALLVITTYFIFGSVPLLILKHDTPMDSRFVQGFFGEVEVAEQAHQSREHAARLRAVDRLNLLVHGRKTGTVPIFSGRRPGLPGWRRCDRGEE